MFLEINNYSSGRYKVAKKLTQLQVKITADGWGFALLGKLINFI